MPRVAHVQKPFEQVVEIDIAHAISEMSSRVLKFWMRLRCRQRGGVAGTIRGRVLQLDRWWRVCGRFAGLGFQVQEETDRQEGGEIKQIDAVTVGLGRRSECSEIRSRVNCRHASDFHIASESAPESVSATEKRQSS